MRFRPNTATVFTRDHGNIPIILFLCKSQRFGAKKFQAKGRNANLSVRYEGVTAEGALQEQSVASY